MQFYDRKEEISVIDNNRMQAENSATFTVLMGRRRVGKTSLLLHALQNHPFAYLFVSKDNETMLCSKFQRVLEQELDFHIYGSLVHFRDLFEAIMRESQQRHFTIIIDEFQNLYRVNPAIFSEMQDLWDRYHVGSKLNLIVCGSIQSLMKRIFEDKNEPLYGRPTAKLMLQPFSIQVIKQILHDNNPTFTSEDLLCLYMITGGVAKYVELLMDARCCTKDKMLRYVCRSDSYFLTEGRDLLNQEFSDDSTTYFSLLQLIAHGITRRGELDGILQKDMGVYLQNLERNYQLIRRVKPVLSRPNSKVTAYEIIDPFLRFWFHFIYPYQSLIETQQYDLLYKHIKENYEQFSGRTLECYFQRLWMESGQYTVVGNWWDRKGENEIDMIALNEWTHTGVVAEIKRNAKKIELSILEQKMQSLPAPEFAKYTLTPQALSLQDM